MEDKSRLLDSYNHINQKLFNEPATIYMEKIINLHHDIIFYLVILYIFVF
jgi:hypothetical protein